MSICIHTLIIRDVYVSCSNLHTWYLYYIDCGKVLTLRMNFLSLNFIPVSPTTLTNITRKKKWFIPRIPFNIICRERSLFSQTLTKLCVLKSCSLSAWIIPSELFFTCIAFFKFYLLCITSFFFFLSNFPLWPPMPFKKQGVISSLLFLPLNLEYAFWLYWTRHIRWNAWFYFPVIVTPTWFFWLAQG